MAGNQGKFRLMEFTVDDMQIRTADGACENFNEQLALQRPWNLSFGHSQPFAGLFQEHRCHFGIHPTRLRDTFTTGPLRSGVFSTLRQSIH
jgi:hypothetical protein